MRPVQPGWVAVPVEQEHPNEWYHIVGWTNEMQPVCAFKTGVRPWFTMFGEDRFCIATLEEWCGRADNST